MTINISTKAIEVKNLKRVFKKSGSTFFALSGVDFYVDWGEIFGLLGPNGAGKTTLIKILSTLLYPTEGEAFVYGFEVTKEAQKVREVINLVPGGESAGYGVLSVKETLWMFSQFYGISTKEANERIEKYLKAVGMWNGRNTLINRLSTGMMQKVNLVRGLISEPNILFLDEPTIGLDVEASRIIRNIVKIWVKERENRAVLLTTHYMAEADELCDRIAIIDKGTLIACDTPVNLKKYVKDGKFFEITVEPFNSLEILKLKELVNIIQAQISIKNSIESQEDIITLILKEEKDISKIIIYLTETRKEIKYLRKVEPTLEDVFLKLVGKSFQDEEKN